MTVYQTAGSKIFIGAAKSPQVADFVAADFSSETWTQINNLENLGSVGDTSAEITFEDIGKGRTQKLKGTRNAGNMELVMGIDAADAGQIALIAAEKTTFDYAFKVELTDKPATGASPKNSLRYFIAKVMSVSEAFDAANNVMKLSVSLGVNSNVVRVAASAT